MKKIINKICKKHGKTQHVFESSTDYYRCKICRKENVNKRRQNRKFELINFHGNKCQICSYDKCIGALEFHHINSKNKKFGIGSGDITSYNKLLAESMKCIMVCANCHREIHEGLIIIESSSHSSTG
jgi:hypothetical protein